MHIVKFMQCHISLLTKIIKVVKFFDLCANISIHLSLEKKHKNAERFAYLRENNIEK